MVFCKDEQDVEKNRLSWSDAICMAVCQVKGMDEKEKD